jgi:integrase/recombinase XerD
VISATEAAIANHRLCPRKKTRRGREDGRLFSSITGRALTRAIAGHVFDDIEEATGIEVSPHSCRHYFGTSLISAGVSVVAVSRWLGHSSPEIT